MWSSARSSVSPRALPRGQRHRGARRARFGLLAIAALAACGRSTSCNGALASVQRTHGQVERDLAAHRDAWQPANEGDALARGDGLRTGPRASAVLKLSNGVLVRVEAETTLRLQLPRDAASQAQAAADVQVETGGAVIEAGPSPLALQTELGLAVLQPGARLRVSAVKGQANVHYHVMLGSAAFPIQSGSRAELRAGQGITVGIGMAVLDSEMPARATAAPRSEPEAAHVAIAPDVQRAEDDAPADRVHALVSGEVRRRHEGEDDWSSLARGQNDLAAGDELEVAKDAEARLSRRDEQATLHHGRYAIGAIGAPLVNAADGTLIVAADRSAVVVRVPGGTIVAEPAPGGSRAKVVVDGSKGQSQVEVIEGVVSARGADGERSLRRGDRAELSASPLDADEAEREDKTKHAPARSADRPDLVVAVGESFRVYDPAPPSAIGFKLGKQCPQGGELRIEGLEPVRGKDQINLLIGPGQRNYRLHCSDDPQHAVASGTLRVLRSDGTRRPPSTPTRNDVELDGRTYTLMYQNLKPIIAVTWPNAPQASGYALQLKRPDGSTTTLRVKQPRTTLDPKALSDGIHSLRFETASGQHQLSKLTKFNLVFDNAAPTASVASPSAAGFAVGASTHVAGIAIAGSRASVGEQDLHVDAAGRFGAEVRLRPGQRSLAIRFRHEKFGIRYYLRRAAEGAHE